MIVVIVEDEPLLARRIERFTKDILERKLTKTVVKNSLQDAMRYLSDHPVDLLLLDLNLHGRDGFDLLKQAVSGAFHTVIISAHTDRALEAFEYGVLDFIGKPFTRERLQKAFSRLETADSKNRIPTKYVAVRKGSKLHLIDVDEIRFIRGADIYSEIILDDGSVELHGKTLSKLNAILPSGFIRTHKSYIVNIQRVKTISSMGGSRYILELHTGEILPVARTKYKEMKTLLSC